MAGTYTALRRRDSNQQEYEENLHHRTRTYVESSRKNSQSYGQEPEGILYQLYSSITSFCHDVLFNFRNSERARHEVPMSTPLYRLFDGFYTNLVLWGKDLDVRSGKLDNDLRFSRELREFTIEVMIQMSETIEKDVYPTILKILREMKLKDSPIEELETKLKNIQETKARANVHAQLNAVPSNYDGVESSSIPEVEESPIPPEILPLQEAFETLNDQVDALLDLTTSLQDPIRDGDTTTDAGEDRASTPRAQEYSVGPRIELTFLEGIKLKNPLCDENLAMAVSKHIYTSTIRLQGKREDAAEPPRPLEKAASELFPKDSGYETATTVSSQYTTTLDSFEDIEDTIKTPFPSQGKHLSLGDKFSCIACGGPRIKSRSGNWRRHVVSDLQPWICCQILCDCNFSSFNKESDWHNHLRSIHRKNPAWDSTTCPFCQRRFPEGNRTMVDHVERHLIQLSLAAITPDHGGSDDEGASEIDSDEEGTLLRSHPAYQDATPEADGLWHCPWEGEADCRHQASKNKADHDKFIEEHLDSLWCKVEGCESNNGQPFATQEILYLHELNEHDMHEGGGRFLCTSPGCGRSRPGNGFMKEWVQIEHIKVVHNNLAGIGLPKKS